MTTRHPFFRTPGGIQTRDLQNRNLTFYSAELRGRNCVAKIRYFFLLLPDYINLRKNHPVSSSALCQYAVQNQFLDLSLAILQVGVDFRFVLLEKVAVQG